MRRGFWVVFDRGLFYVGVATLTPLRGDFLPLIHLGQRALRARWQ